MLHRFRDPTRSLLNGTLGAANVQALAARYDDWVGRWHYALDPAGRRSAAQLRALKDSFRGQRCFIIGNGPSLQGMDLSPLRNEFTFGLNRIYLASEKMGFSTTFLVVVNPYVLEQCGDEIASQPSKTFVSWQHRGFLPADNRAVFFRAHHRPGFSQDVSRWLWPGATVTYAAMQLAYHLGFSEVILIGVDHSFVTSGEPGKLVTLQGGDPNHFDSAYFANGFRWQLPDLDMSELAYRLAQRHFAADGRHVYDATIDGKLTVFPKRAFESFFTPEQLRPSRPTASARLQPVQIAAGPAQSRHKIAPTTSRIDSLMDGKPELLKVLPRRAHKALRLLRTPLWRKALRHGVAATIEHEALPLRSSYGAVIDVGAHKGQFALYARARFPDATLYCFEPLDGPRHLLQRVLARDDALHVVAAAAGATPGKARINVSRRDDSSSLLEITHRQAAMFPGTEKDGNVETEVVALDSYFTGRDLTSPVLLKLDVQGYELEALRGAAGLLARVDSVLVECSFRELYAGQPLFDEVVAWLRGHGFALRAGNLSSTDPDGAWVQGDFLFERADDVKQPAAGQAA
jgi:FkbM family methyltransferase